MYAGYCHCGQCRAASGSTFATFAGIERERLRIVLGDECISSGAKGETQRVNFCRSCGGAMFFVLRQRRVRAHTDGAYCTNRRESCRVFMHSPRRKRRGTRSPTGCRSFPRTHRPVGSACFRIPAAEPIRRHRRAAVSIRGGFGACSTTSTPTSAILSISRHWHEWRTSRRFTSIAYSRHGSARRSAEYLRNRRLDRAAAQLVGEPQTSVLSVAVAVGFGSGEALARAFKQRFGCTPSTWRSATPRERAERLRRVAVATDGKHDQVVRNARQASDAGDAQYRSRQFTTEMHMNVNVIEMPPTRVAYLRHLGAYGPGVGAFWNETAMPVDRFARAAGSSALWHGARQSRGHARGEMPL